MWNGFIGNLIRRTNQRLIIAALLILAGLTVFFGYNRSYFLGFFAGPHPASAQQLTSAATPAAFRNPFVTITDEHADPTALQGVHESEGHAYVDSSFVSAIVGGHHMLVRMSIATDPLKVSHTLTGQIKSVDDLRGHLYGEYETPQGDLLPIYLDTYEYKEFGYVSVIICAPILLLALWMLWRWWQVSSDFSRHPLCRRLAAQGQLELLVQQIDSEMAAPHLTVGHRANAVHLTPHWLLITNFFNGIVMPMAGVVWVYRSLVKRRIYFFITVSKRHLLNVFDQTGQKGAVQLNDPKTAQLFDALRVATPRAVHGYDKRLLSLWRRTPNKAGFPDAAAAILSGQELPDQRVTSQYGG